MEMENKESILKRKAIVLENNEKKPEKRKGENKDRETNKKMINKTNK